MGPPTDPGPSGSARISKWSVRPCSKAYSATRKFRPPVPSSAPTSFAHLCPAVHPPVPSSAPTLCSVTHLCPEVPPTCAQKCHPPVPTHLCPPVPPTCAHPPVLPTSATHQCSPAVLPVSATSQCPGVVPISASSQCPAVMPVSAVYQYPSSVSPISAAYQCCILVPPIRDTSLVLSISAAYPCHLISAAYQCPSVPPISAHQCCLINAHQ
ncbi:unnamed protein product [Staurois parvus]|uniref:Uncharacterized protein n=1 Tax=Staurois parvus TaxID=386267 RepID=A0ABN9H5W2_9NEOB|nr:unnamed protein product [Staurois parvus]